jgi:hypothetical protein
MLRPVRGTLAGLAFGSTVAAGVVFGTVCSVDRAGLSNGDASISSFGGSSGGSSSMGGIGGAAGGKGGTSVLGTGGAANGTGANGGGQTGGAGGANAGTGGAPGTGGENGGTGGVPATGGTTGTGGDNHGTGGTPGTGGDSGGTGGAPATGGTIGTGGTPATGGAPGTGGAPATGGTTGTGGAPATGGTTGTGGAGGTGGSHTPSCASFPKGATFVTPTDSLLHCYWTHSQGTDWDSCVSDGGTLATILSSQENMFVLSVLIQPNLFNGLGVSIGATDGRASSDKSGAGTYAWVTGEPWSYTNWHMDHPDGACTCQGSSSCACDHWLVMFNDGTWWDRPDKVARPYICEAIAR